MSAKTYCLVVRDTWAVGPDFGEAVKDAMERHERSRRCETVSYRKVYGPGNVSVGYTGAVIGSGMADFDHVYVIHGNGGEQVTDAKTVSQASLDALVNVLRKHGYTCRRTGGGS